MYHAKCLVDLYRHADNIQLGGKYNDEKRKHGLAFAAVVSLIENDISFSDNLDPFGHYAGEVVIPHLSDALKDVKRLDVVWDVYISNSLKKTPVKTVE